MEEGDDKVMTINLHKIVTRECGPIPFENCYMMKKPHDVVRKKNLPHRGKMWGEKVTRFFARNKTFPR